MLTECAPRSGTRAQEDLSNSSVAVAYMLWPALVMQSLRILDCSVSIAGELYVASDLRVKCDVGSHSTLKSAAIFNLVIVVPGLPVYLAYRMLRCPLGKGSFNREHFYFLYGGFKEGYEFWEAVVLTRKFFVLAVSVFLADNTFGLQVAATMWIMCAATFLQLHYQPYHNKTEQMLEKVSLGSIAVACMLGQVIFQADGEKGLGTTGLAFVEQQSV